MQVKPQMLSSRNCLNCRHFQMAGSNRGCLNPEKVHPKNGVCSGWQNAYSLNDRILFNLRLKNKPVRSIIK